MPQMDEIIIRSLSARLTAQESVALLAWRVASPENEQRYRDVVTVWRLAGAASSEARRSPVRGASAPSGLSGAWPATRPLHVRRTAWRAVAGLAAVVILAVGVRAGALRLPGSTTRLAPAEYVTGPTERSTIQLADGTVVRLAPATTLKVLDGPVSRSVWLSGRAYFAVTKRTGIPFRVHTRGGETTVLGTQFEVRTQGADVDVVVVEGRVQLSSGHQAAEILPGQRRTIVDGVVSGASAVGDVQAEVAWVGHLLLFDGTSLQDVATRIARVFGLQVRLLPDAPRDRLITGWFSDQTAAETVSAICLAAAVTCSWQDSTVTIGR